LRSPHPHARIKRIDTTPARALPGVFAVVTGEDAKELTGPLPAFCAEPVVQYALAVDKVRFVGEAVAAAAAGDPCTTQRPAAGGGRRPPARLSTSSSPWAPTPSTRCRRRRPSPTILCRATSPSRRRSASATWPRTSRVPTA